MELAQYVQRRKLSIIVIIALLVQQSPAVTSQRVDLKASRSEGDARTWKPAWCSLSAVRPRPQAAHSRISQP